MKNILYVTGVLLLVVSSFTYFKPDFSPAPVDQESERANAFFERVFNEALDRNPVFQTQLGIKKDYGKWDDPTDEFARMELDIAQQNLQWLKDSIRYEALNPATQLSYDLFVREVENNAADFKYRYHEYPVNQMFGFHADVPSFLINMHQVGSVEDAEAYIARLEGIATYFDQFIARLKTGEERGILPPKFVFPRVIGDAQNIISGQPFVESSDTSALYQDIYQKVNALEADAGKKEALLERAEKALVSSVKPAYEQLISFLKEQAQRATTDDGVWKWPEGDAYYANALKRTTTTNLTAEEIHQIGLKEVARIHDEMRTIMKQVSFEGDLQDFFQFMREDEQFYYPNTDAGKQAYMDSAKAIIDTMRDRLDELFIVKPKADMVVKRVEAFREKSAGKAFYNQPAPDGSRPGMYYANLHDAKNMPKYEMEALAYHEGIPGHHMQIAIAQELEGIPKFRKFGGYTAYIEGWGLYCEKIPKEMGLYQDPYSDFGRLAMELWRACRLVVDTGIHDKKWTREEGIAYYQTNTSASERECVRMVERHIVMPGQATAYKIGMMKILELREGAKKQLGDRFDIRKFHDVILKQGALPLDVLEQRVDAWVTSQS